MAQPISTKDFKDRSRPATIISVDPQKKQVSVQYTQQDGIVPNLELPFQNVGTTWGRLYMPQVGDRVYIDYTQGELPVIIGMKPLNVDYLPYLDPGEMAETNSDGSFMHFRNKRRRVKSTNTLIDYDATTGPNGETDIETEPGGIVLGVRSKKDISTKAPRWYEHSYMSMFDNGDIAIQSRYQSKEKGLLYFDGASGYVFLVAGDGKPQEYVELNPLLKEIVIMSDGDVHQHTEKDWKITTYNNQVQNIGNIFEMTVGIDTTQISGQFDQINPDSDLNKGDIRITNQQTAGTGKLYLAIKGDVDIALSEGNFNVTTTTGTVNINSQGDVTVNSQGNVDINGSSAITLNGGTGRLVTSDDFDNHSHHGVQSGPSSSGGPNNQTADRKAYL